MKVNRRQVLKTGAALAAAGAIGQGFAQEFYAKPATLLPAPGPPGWWWWGAAGAGPPRPAS
jgi:anaerobic selenocysteine-containing dehydrogenase